MTKKILAVDDSRTMRQMVVNTLQNAGFEAHEAEDGEAGLKLFGDHAFDLIITDLNIPKMDGLELIQKVRQGTHRPFVPILMLTTEANTQQKERGRAVGATGWIVKPFNPDKLIEIVQKVCNVSKGST